MRFPYAQYLLSGVPPIDPSKIGTHILNQGITNIEEVRSRIVVSFERLLFFNVELLSIHRQHE